MKNKKSAIAQRAYNTYIANRIISLLGKYEPFKPFNDEEIDLITKINHIYFKIGFRCAADLFK